MNCYFLEPSVEFELPQKAKSKVVKEIISNFTFEKITNLSFERNDNTIIIGNGETILADDADFTINVTHDGIAICGVSYPCLMNGLTTMLELLCYDKEKGHYLPFGTYSDKAQTKFRSAHLCIFPETKLEYLIKCIRSCAFAKYTHILLEFWGMFKFDCLKELSWPFAHSKETIKELARETNALGVEIIPMFNHLGHASGCRILHGKHVVLDQNPKYEYMFKAYGWEWNYDDEEVYTLLENIRSELIDACGEGKYFHIGCDEAYTSGVNVETTANMTNYINRVSDSLKKKGRRAIMWGDMLLCKNDLTQFENNYYANSLKEISDYLLNNISKDIIIADWQYEAFDDVWETTKILNSYGFTVLCCPWNSEENIISAVKTANTLGTMGIMETTWHTLITVFPLMVFGGYYSYSFENEKSVHPLYKTRLAKDTFRCHAATIARKVSPSGGEYLNAGWTEESVGAGL